MAMIFATMPDTDASSISGKPQFTLKVIKEKAFDKFWLFATFNITSGNIAECLERCLENCRCQSFQICQNKTCQLCSRHKEEDISLLHAQKDCIYATYEMRHSAKISQVIINKMTLNILLTIITVSNILGKPCTKLLPAAKTNLVLYPVNTI